jgi:hypothetical protein
VTSDGPETVRTVAWPEVAEALKSFETAAGFDGPTQLLAAGRQARPRNPADPATCIEAAV